MTKPRITLDHIPDKSLRAIGEVAAMWSVLEGAAERLVWRVGSLPETIGLCITTHMPLANRFDAAAALMKERFPGSPHIARLPKLAEHIRKNLAPKRNNIVHSRVIHLGSDTDPSFQLQYKARGTLRKELASLDEPTTKELVREIAEAAAELRDMLTAFPIPSG
jgi:hypothetical protein